MKEKNQREQESNDAVVVCSEAVERNTSHDHFYQEGKRNGDLKDVICECGHGMQINHKVKVENGRILWPKQ